MLRRFGWFHWLLGLRAPLDHMRLDEASAERIRDAAQHGPIVYVMLKSNDLDHLALNKVLNANRLPLSVWANDVTQFFWEPVVDAWRGLLRRSWVRITGRLPPDPVHAGLVGQAVREGLPLTVFLEKRTGIWRRITMPHTEDPLPALFDAQEDLDRPVQLLPVLVSWQRGFDRPVHPALRAILPDPERPGGLMRLWKLALYAKDNVVQVGDPVDLREFMERVPSDQQRRRTLYVLLRRFLRRESQVVRGPRLPAPADLKRMVLDNPPMRELARSEAGRLHLPIDRIQTRMEREYDHIAAHMRWWVIRFLDFILRPLWTRVYSGVDAPEEDMERIRAAIREGAAIVLPSHKSHFDYMLLAWVFYNNKLTLPHVVAGANLAIPVVSFFLRSAGGFFIKRRFDDDRIHPAVFSRYLRELVHHGIPIEAYIEGGRTRSGKLLSPKVGVLGMVLDAAALRPRGKEVTVLPVALAYEQVAEQGAYVRELGGQTKRKENLGEFARATRVIRRRLGRVYFRVGDPIHVSEIVDATSEQPGWLDRDPAERKQALHTLAKRVMYRVGQRTVLLPTTLVALGLLAHHRRGIRQEELFARVERFRDFIARYGVPQAATLGRLDEAIRLSLARLANQRIVEAFEHDSERVWAVRLDRRLELDFSKNQGLHPFTAAGMVACAIRGRPDDAVLAAELEPAVGYLERLWRFEFSLHPDEDTAALVERGLRDLEAHGALASTDEGWVVADVARIAEIFGLMRPFLEGYRVALGEAASMTGTTPGRKEWVSALQKRQDALLAADAISRPESLSLVTLENAVKVMLDDGALREDGRRQLSADTVAARALLGPLDKMVGA